MADLVITEPSIETPRNLPTTLWNDRNVYLTEGDTVTITCGVYGEEQPSITWYKGLNQKITDSPASFPRFTISDDEVMKTSEV